MSELDTIARASDRVVAPGIEAASTLQAGRPNTGGRDQGQSKPPLEAGLVVSVLKGEVGRCTRKTT